MMMTQILKYVDLSKTQIFKYIFYKYIYIFSNEKIH